MRLNLLFYGIFKHCVKCERQFSPFGWIEIFQLTAVGVGEMSNFVCEMSNHGKAKHIFLFGPVGFKLF